MRGALLAVAVLIASALLVGTHTPAQASELDELNTVITELDRRISYLQSAQQEQIKRIWSRTNLSREERQERAQRAREQAKERRNRIHARKNRLERKAARIEKLRDERETETASVQQANASTLNAPTFRCTRNTSSTFGCGVVSPSRR